MKDEDKLTGVILAGGEGTRLRPLSYYFQKCMIPVGTNQRPLLEYIIRFLRYHGITDVRLLVGYKNEQIKNYFEKGKRFGINLNYLLDDPKTKGTGAALLNLYKKENLNRGTILIYYGDILSNIDLTEMMNQHRREKSAVTLAVVHGYQVPVGVASVDGTRVVRWVEKPQLNLDVGIGILAIDAEILEQLSQMGKGAKELDITRDFIPWLQDKGYPVGAYVTDSFWYDIGSTEKYEKLDNGLIDKTFKFLFSEE